MAKVIGTLNRILKDLGYTLKTYMPSNGTLMPPLQTKPKKQSADYPSTICRSYGAGADCADIEINIRRIRKR